MLIHIIYNNNNSFLFLWLWIILVISTGNHMFGRAIWNKLAEWIFESFEITRVKTRAISKFSKITRVIFPKNRANQTCDYWLMLTAGNYKSASCKSILWFHHLWKTYGYIDIFYITWNCRRFSLWHLFILYLHYLHSYYIYIYVSFQHIRQSHSVLQSHSCIDTFS